MQTRETWPTLPYEAWKDTHDTLHMWLQMVGKVKLELCSFRNHWWEVTLHLTSRGLTTGPIPWQGESFDIDFDFIDQRLLISVSDGRRKEITLEPRTVADFYRLFKDALTSLGITVTISTLPAEVANPIHFEQDTTHASYDGAYAQKWWRVMMGVQRAMERFQIPYYGKSSPIHFFWGGFDLNVARFNGKSMTPPPYGGDIMKFGENAENFSFGFWPGTDQFPHAALYSYILPAPQKIEEAKIQPDAAHFDTNLGEFILLYDDVRSASSPEEAIVTFFKSTYEAGTTLAGWNRASLEGPIPHVGA